MTVRARRPIRAALLLGSILAIVLSVAVMAAKPDKLPGKPAEPSHPEHPRADDPAWPQWSPAPFGGTPLPRPTGAASSSSGPGIILLPDTAGD